MGLFTSNKDKDKKADKKLDNVKIEKDASKKNSEKESSDKKMDSKVKLEKKGDKSSKGEKIKQTSAYKILIRPLITEKINLLKEQNKYAFEVSWSANKIEVGKAINEVYDVKPISVNILNKIGKKVRRGRVTGKRKDWKKAIVTLPKGKSLNIYKT